MQIYKYANRAFTLIELLVVISIIGILIALSVFGLQSARQSSRDARRKADLEQIRSGLEIYKADCNRYPSGTALPSPLVGTITYGSSCLPTNTYISTLPVDPTSPGSSYGYSSSDGVTYILCAALEQVPNPEMEGIASCNGKCGSASCNYIVTNP
jgi:prepilin-type N-terminal cleavage/methylation domain-containing protein